MKSIIKVFVILLTIKLHVLGAVVTFDWNANTTGDTVMDTPYTTTAKQTVSGEELSVVVDAGGLLVGYDSTSYFATTYSNLNEYILVADAYSVDTTSYTLSVTGGKSFDLIGFSMLDVYAEGGTLVLTTSKGTVTQAYCGSDG